MDLAEAEPHKRERYGREQQSAVCVGLCCREGSQVGEPHYHTGTHTLKVSSFPVPLHAALVTFPASLHTQRE